MKNLQHTFLILFFLFLANIVFAQKSKVVVNKLEAQKAFEYLNEVRLNPEKYAKELGLTDTKNVKRTKLVWNDQLAKVAEYRASDMAIRKYFDHINPEGIGPNYYIHKVGYHLNSDWIKKKNANNFESIAANHPTAIEAIKAFIIGKGSPNFMHRTHVLGMNDWYASLYDIGIGFVHAPEGSQYKTYLCVIIAKHDW